MKKDARAALRKTQNPNSKIQIVTDLSKFRGAWRRAVGWKRYVPPLSHLIALKNSFKENSLFLTANISEPKQYNGSNRYTVAGGIFLRADKTAYYWQAFTDAQGRKLNAQSKIVWEGILWAKRRGAKVFDFEGIYDSRFPNKSWLGFTHFKKSFGGYEVSYPGVFVKNSIIGKWLV